MAERRARTRERIVAVALEVMTEEGAAGLTLGEVARRLGMRTPSLYGYFDSRSDLCDELFARGWRELDEATAPLSVDADLREVLLDALGTVVGRALEHPGHAQLMFWRPIPGWQPSRAAFAPAIASMQRSVNAFRRFQERGVVTPDVPAEDLAQLFACLTVGVISQQLSNEPDVSLAEGRASRHLTALAGMFADHVSTRSLRSTP